MLGHWERQQCIAQGEAGEEEEGTHNAHPHTHVGSCMKAGRAVYPKRARHREPRNKKKKKR